MTPVISAKVRPRIALVAHSVSEQVYGAERSFLDLAAAVDPAHFALSCIVPGRVDSYMAAMARFTTDVSVLQYGWWGREGVGREDEIAQFMAHFRSREVDLVHVNTITLISPLIAARRLGLPAILHARELIGLDDWLSAHFGLPPHTIVSTVQAHADFIIANSQAVHGAFQGVVPTYELHNCVDVDRLDILHAIEPGLLKIGIISSNHLKKGVDDFMRLALAAKGDPRLRFIVFGPRNDHTAALEAIAQQEGGAGGNLEFRDYVPDPLEALRELNVVVSFSSVAESFGRTIAEAMAARRPVVAYDWGATRELVRHGEDGFLVPYLRYEQALDHLVTLADNPDRVLSMGENGRRRACASFSSTTFAAKLRTIYESILSDWTDKKSVFGRALRSDATRRDLEAQLTQLRAEIATAGALDGSARRLSDVVAQLAQSHDEITRALAAVAAAEHEHAQLRADVAALRGDNARLAAELDSATLPAGRVRARSGAWIYVDPEDGRGKQLIVSQGDLNPPSLVVWHALLAERRWTHVVDVGANYGEMLVSGGLPPGACITAIEPNPAVAARLQRTLREAGVPATILGCALSDAEGEGRFVVDAAWSGTSRLATPEDAGGTIVRLTTLGALLRGFNRPLGEMLAAVKIDVEGFEAAVLRGGMPELAQLGAFTALVEIVRGAPADVAWIDERFDTRVLELGDGGRLVPVPRGQLSQFLDSGRYYAHDIVVSLSSPLSRAEAAFEVERAALQSRVGDLTQALRQAGVDRETAVAGLESAIAGLEARVATLDRSRANAEAALARSAAAVIARLDEEACLSVSDGHRQRTASELASGRRIGVRPRWAAARGDLGRDRRDWLAGYRGYRAALDRQPLLAGVLVQAGHCLKELGFLPAAEGYYRSGLLLGAPFADTAEHLAFVAGQNGCPLAETEIRRLADRVVRQDSGLEQLPTFDDLVIIAAYLGIADGVDASVLAALMREGASTHTAVAGMLLRFERAAPPRGGWRPVAPGRIALAGLPAP